MLTENNAFQLCAFAYDTRHSEFLLQLQLCSAKTQQKASFREKYDSFASVRHYLGRLAHHVRAPKQLCLDAPHMSYILQSYEVCEIDLLPCAPSPPPDGHTNLDGILNRMLGKSHKERLEVERGLHHLNSLKGIFSQFMTEYNGLNPRVHAEVQVLEHFHNNRLVFARGDRFIACSKPACLCCEMYFKYHPARVSVPESHRKIWINWGPPLIRNYSKTNPAANEQRDILNQIIREISGLITSQVLGQGPASHWHPDSKTGISHNSDLPVWAADSWKHQRGEILVSPKRPPGEPREVAMEQKYQGDLARYGPSDMSGEDSDLDGGVSL